MEQILPYLDLILPYVLPAIIGSGIIAVVFLIITITIRCSAPPKKLKQFIRDNPPQRKKKKRKAPDMPHDTVTDERKTERINGEADPPSSRPSELTNGIKSPPDNTITAEDPKGAEENAAAEIDNDPLDIPVEEALSSIPVSPGFSSSPAQEETAPVVAGEENDVAEMDLVLEVMNIAFDHAIMEKAVTEDNSDPPSDTVANTASPEGFDVPLTAPGSAPADQAPPPDEPATAPPINEAPLPRKKVLQGTISPRVQKKLDELFDIPVASEQEGWDGVKSKY